MTDNLLFTIRQISCSQFDTQRKSTLNHTEIVCGRRDVICCGWHGKFFLSYVFILGVWLGLSSVCLFCYLPISSANRINRTNLCFGGIEERKTIFMEFNNCLFTLCRTNCWGYNNKTRPRKCHKAHIFRRDATAMPLPLVVIHSVLNVCWTHHSVQANECVRCRARFMWITMSCKNWMTVAAGNGLNKWILCNLCHFVLNSSDGALATPCTIQNIKSLTLTASVKYYFRMKMEANQVIAPRNDDDGTS